MDDVPYSSGSSNQKSLPERHNRQPGGEGTLQREKKAPRFQLSCAHRRFTHPCASLYSTLQHLSRVRFAVNGMHVAVHGPGVASRNDPGMKIQSGWARHNFTLDGTGYTACGDKIFAWAPPFVRLFRAPYANTPAGAAWNRQVSAPRTVCTENSYAELTQQFKSLLFHTERKTGLNIPNIECRMAFIFNNLQKCFKGTSKASMYFAQFVFGAQQDISLPSPENYLDQNW